MHTALRSNRHARDAGKHIQTTQTTCKKLLVHMRVSQHSGPKHSAVGAQYIKIICVMIPSLIAVPHRCVGGKITVNLVFNRCFDYTSASPARPALGASNMAPPMSKITEDNFFMLSVLHVSCAINVRSTR